MMRNTWDREIEAIASGKVAPLYLLTGDEEYWKDKVVKALIDRLEAQGGCEYSRAEGLEGLRWAVDCLMTVPMLGGQRLYRVKLGVEDLGKLDRATEERIGSFLRSPGGGCLVLDAQGQLSRVHTGILRQARVVECPRPRPSALARWLIREAKARGCQLEREAAYALAFAYAGTGVRMAMSELEKLCHYVGEGRIGRREVSAVASASSSVRIFDLFDAMAEGRVEEVLKSAAALRSAGEHPLRMLAALANHLRLLLFCRLALDRGMSTAEIHKQLSQHPYVVRKALQAARGLSSAALKRALLLALWCDEAIKTGKMREDAAFQIFLWRSANMLSGHGSSMARDHR